MTATQENFLVHMMTPGDDGDVHLILQNASALAYAHKDQASDWEEAFREPESVASEFIGSDYGVASLAVDAQGIAHAAWISGTELRYAARDAIAGWSAPITLFERADADMLNLHLFADQVGRPAPAVARGRGDLVHRRQRGVPLGGMCPDVRTAP